MKTITLWGLNGAILIYPCSSGILLTNQVGGTACLQLSVEGTLIPIEQKYSMGHTWLSDLELALYSIFKNCEKIDLHTANLFDELMQASIHTNFITINRQKLNNSCEAWVHVCVNEAEFASFQGFGVFEGIVTWNNSD